MMLRREFASHEMGPQGESQDVGWRGKVKFPLDGFTFTAKDTPNCFRFSFLSHVPLCPEMVVRFTCTRGSLVTASAIMASILGCYCGLAEHGRNRTDDAQKMKYSHKNCIEPINLANASNADALV